MENKQNNSESLGFFLDFYDTSAILIDTKDNIVRFNDKLKSENEVFLFFNLNPNEKKYSLNQIDKEQWDKQFNTCIATGGAKFILRSSFNECVMTRLEIRNEKYVLVNFFEVKALNEDVAELSSPDFNALRLKDLNEMAANTAHEINNPLTVIFARTQLLIQAIQDQKEITNEVLQLNLEKIYHQSNRIKKIVDGMRAHLSRTNHKQAS